MLNEVKAPTVESISSSTVEVNCQEEIDIKEIIDKVWDREKKPRTKEQLIAARKTAIKIVNDLDECISELGVEGYCKFEEPLDQQFKRIFGITMPSEAMTKELFQEVIIPVLKIMSKDDRQFFYKHYGGVVPQGFNYKYYL